MTAESNGLLDLCEMLQRIAGNFDCQAHLRMRLESDDFLGRSGQRAFFEFVDSETQRTIWGAAMTIDMIKDSLIPPTQIMKDQLNRAIKQNGNDAP